MSINYNDFPKGLMPAQRNRQNTEENALLMWETIGEGVSQEGEGRGMTVRSIPLSPPLREPNHGYLEYQGCGAYFVTSR